MGNPRIRAYYDWRSITARSSKSLGYVQHDKSRKWLFHWFLNLALFGSLFIITSGIGIQSKCIISQVLPNTDKMRGAKIKPVPSIVSWHLSVSPTKPDDRSVWQPWQPLEIVEVYWHPTSILLRIGSTELQWVALSFVRGIWCYPSQVMGKSVNLGLAATGVVVASGMSFTLHWQKKRITHIQA